MKIHCIHALNSQKNLKYCIEKFSKSKTITDYSLPDSRKRSVEISACKHTIACTSEQRPIQEECYPKLLSFVGAQTISPEVRWDISWCSVPVMTSASMDNMLS